MLDGNMKYVPPVQVFKGCKKILEQLPEHATPLDFFKLYFTDAVVNLLVVETNRFSQQYIVANVISSHSAVNDWQPTDHNEMLSFLGLCILMSIVYKPILILTCTR